MKSKVHCGHQKLLKKNRIDDGTENGQKVNLVLNDIVVAVDPAVTYTEKSDHTGIVVVGSVGSGLQREFYVLEDYSIKAPTHVWAKEAVVAWWKSGASHIIYESNQGGDTIKDIILTAASKLLEEGAIDVLPRLEAVRATQGKMDRAEPVANLYMLGRVHHYGKFILLEEQMLTWSPASSEKSPDRLDALVHGIRFLNPTPSRGAPAGVGSMR